MVSEAEMTRRIAERFPWMGGEITALNHWRDRLQMECVEARQAGGVLYRTPVYQRGIANLNDFIAGPLGEEFSSNSNARRALSAEERQFMLRDAGRLESELRWLRNNNATVHQVYKEARRANLSETTAAEMALICLAREMEDAGRSTSASAPVQRRTEIHQNLCPACGINLSPLDAEPSLIRHRPGSYYAPEERAVIFSGECMDCGAPVESVVSEGGGVHLRACARCCRSRC